MSTDTRTAAHDSDTEKSPGTPRPAARRTRRVIAATLFGGAAGAAALSLGVFAGATEATITGSILLAFGAAWGAMAGLSRKAAEPMRWASVPAVAMSAVGLGLLAFQPGDSTLTALSWVWPALMLALVVWMSRQIRRSTRAGRWLLTPVVAVLALASLGTTYENVAASRDNHSHPAPGRLFEVNGHRLHLDCRGQGGPTVVLFNGLGEVSASWARIASSLTSTVRVCAYDRAGQGWSGDVSHPQDGVAAAKDLHALLAAADEHGPFVLAGHSIGGPFAMTYAARYPTQVAGMVLLDSSSPEQFTRMPAYPGQYAVIRRVYALMPTLYRFGLGRVGAAAVPSHLPAQAADQVRAVTSSAHGARNMRDDASMLHQVFGQAQALTTLDGRPLAVVTASGSLDDTVGWAAAQDVLAALSDDHLHTVVQSSHTGLLEDRAPAAESVKAISWVVDAVRAR
ncbi:alpha/beta fold hydrolase [Nocardioides pocheonensis]|uniref:Alpha/beta hydrolase n=1 Tax=Nocardioides pocheonensis TaxID=661485 RepID=A0A3N0GNJ7_9ACTN|nr:alpha/beta hydrolase [Nocardioides pocheonensis]RNM14054.1 alpha/beta hydrolase [Nocardioides pocheonensis]